MSESPEGRVEHSPDCCKNDGSTHAGCNMPWCMYCTECCAAQTGLLNSASLPAEPSVAGERRCPLCLHLQSTNVSDRCGIWACCCPCTTFEPVDSPPDHPFVPSPYMLPVCAVDGCGLPPDAHSVDSLRTEGPETFDVCSACKGTGSGQGDNTYCGQCGGDGTVEISPQSPGEVPERSDVALVELLCQSYGRSLLYPDSKIQHDLANECRAEVLKRLAAARVDEEK